MWAPVYNRKGVATSQRTNLVYSVDLVRGLDVYVVDVPGRRASARSRRSRSARARPSRPGVVVGGSAAVALLLHRRRRRRAPGLTQPSRSTGQLAQREDAARGGRTSV